MNDLYTIKENLKTTLGTKRQKSWIEKNKWWLRIGGTAVIGSTAAGAVLR